MPGRGIRITAMLVFAFALPASQAAGAYASVADQSKSPVRESSAWKRFVIDPGKFAYPKAVYVVGNQPQNAHNTSGLKGPGQGAMTLNAGPVNASGVGSPALL